MRLKGNASDALTVRGRAVNSSEAEAIRIQAQAITQQGGSDYVNLKAVEKWDGHLPVQMIPNATLPFINLSK